MTRNPERSTADRMKATITLRQVHAPIRKAQVKLFFSGQVAENSADGSERAESCQRVT